jgi:membrane protease subunit HflK
MSWNEPKGGTKHEQRDPWGQGQGNGQGPPDLDEAWKKARQKLKSTFGGKGGGSGQGAGSGGPGPAGMLAIAALLVLGWLATGFYTVDDAEQGIVLRFGAYDQTVGPGLHWRIPWPVESVERVNINEIRRFNHETLMLTKDENIIDVNLNIQYKVSDPHAYLFNVQSPDRTLEEVTESAVREVVGTNMMDYILGEGRTYLETTTLDQVQSTLISYEAGIDVTQVNLQDANFPQAVQPAVEDAIKAREDKERLELEAESYANDVIPRARGGAARRIEQAEGYRARLVNQAEGDASRFTQLLQEYQRAPGVTRERLYLESMEEVLGRTPKVILDVADGSGNMIYLPVDKLLERHRGSRSQDSSSNGGDSGGDRMNPTVTLGENARGRDTDRNRGGRR